MEELKEYMVIWRIQLSATTPEEAAKEAKAVLQDEFSDAWTFEVVDERDERGIIHDVDLSCSDDVET